MTLFTTIAAGILLVLTLLSSAVNLSLRQFSRFRLAELLKSRDQEDRFDRLIEQGKQVGNLEAAFVPLVQSTVNLVQRSHHVQKQHRKRQNVAQADLPV